MVIVEIRSALLMVGVPPVKYAGQSFHIVAASTAALCEIKNSTIKTLGWWIVTHICTTLKSLEKHWLITPSSCVGF